MSAEFLIALRYLKSRRKKFLPSISALISAFGIMLGVCALIVVLSVMGGFSADLQDKILGTHSHILVRSHEGSMRFDRDLISKIYEIDDEIKGVTPFIYSDVMITSQTGVAPLRLIGIDPETMSQAKDVKKYIIDGELEHVVNPPTFLRDKIVPGEKASHNGVILGESLAFNLSVVKGDYINIVSPLGKMGPMGSLPRMKRFKVVGAFQSGMYEYDSKFAYVSLKAAQQFLEMDNNIGGIEVKIKDIYKAQEIGKKIEEALGFPYYTQDWMALNKNLFAALKLERIMIAILLTCIILVAAFGIISSLSMLVIEKKRDISILKTFGATKYKIMKIFILNGFIIGLIGTSLGEFLGWFLCMLLKKYQFIKLPMDVYALTTLPVKMVVTDFIWIGLVSIIISIGATIYPSYKAARVDPVEGLRYV